jgi:hypothetical protein
MATYTDFEGIIDNVMDFGAPLDFKAALDGLVLQSFIRLAPNDVKTLLDNIWHYYLRTLTESASGSLTQEEHDHLMSIPKNPLLDSDTRLNNLNADISSRASKDDLEKHDKKQTSLKFAL